MFGSILQSIRKNSGLSQIGLAQASKTYQANISNFENELTSPSFDTANQLLKVCGYKLIPVPFTSPTISEWGFAIDRALVEGQEKRAFRLFLQINNQLLEAPVEILGAMSITPPSIKDPRYSALISGLVQYHLKKRHLPIPSWVSPESNKLKTPWFVQNETRLENHIRQNTPVSFSKFNVFISESELQSV